MYADCWGEVGWTIVDYYLRRKPAWYFVKRALSPVRLILRQHGDEVRVTLANDTQSKASGTLEFGRMALDGASQQLKRKAFSCPPLARKVIATFKRGAGDPACDVWMARVVDDEAVWPALLRAADNRNMRMAQPRLTAKVARAGKGRWSVHVSSDVFAHAVHLGLPANAIPADDYFDLLPGQTRTVTVTYSGPLSRNDICLSSVVCNGN
jgi:beta-mannosidase